MASPFELALGLYQGRIRPTRWTAAQGDYVYQLGHDLPGQVVRLDFGNDEHRLSQSIDFDVTPLQLIRLVVHERGPTSMPVGKSWALYGEIDTGIVGGFAITVEPGRERTRRDLAIDVHGLTGVHAIDLVLLAAGSGVAEAELPGVYIDALQLVHIDPDRPTVFNRDPEPGDRDVDPSQAITFALADLRGLLLDPAYDVYVDGALAISAGALQAPWDTSGSSLTPRATGYDVRLVPTLPWDSLSEHTVRVVASANNNGSAIDLSWNFTIKDLTPPQLLSAFARSETEVVLTFDEALGTGATVAANYTVALVSGTPAVTPIPVSASSEASGVVVLTLDRAQTPLAVYAVTVADVEDAHGNVVAAPYNVAQWAGYECPKPPGRKLDLYRQWPAAYRAEDAGDLRGLIAIHQEILDGILCEIDRYPERVLDPDTCDEVHLDQMLRDMGSPFGFLPLSVTDKRRLMRVLIPLLRLKGTEAGIEDAIRTLLGIEVDVVPFMPQMIAWAPGLGAGTLSGTLVLMSGSLAKQLQFDIVSSVLLTDVQRAQMRRIAGVMRRSVCRLRNIVEPDGSPPPAVPLGLGAGRLSIDLVLL